MKFEQEEIIENVFRIKIPEGYIYLYVNSNGGNGSICFVPKSKGVKK
ncbi:MAG: hypothetical protein Q7R52_02695 [archaeon]|nr:hypothetical protein [archaeon]